MLELTHRNIARDGKKKKKAAITPIATTRSASPAMSDSPPSRDGSVTPPPNTGKSNSLFKPCVMCKRPEPKATNYRCSNCGITVHTQCFGIPESAGKAGWMCDVCNLDSQEDEATTSSKSSGKPSCSLCPANKQSHQKSGLDAFKRTAESR